MSPAENREKVPVSILIPTKDEERNLPSTLAQLGWADEIVIFDSFSTDATLAIARSAGCEVHQREFDNFADHKNWALRSIDFRHEWILILDADEKVTPALADEIRGIVAGPSRFDAYYVARQIWVDGVWLKHAGKYPDYQMRLFRRGMAWYERRIVHEHMETSGRAGYLKHHLVHVDAKGIQRNIERHCRYAEMEAVEAFIIIHATDSETTVQAAPLNALRRRLKNFAYRHVPFRPLMVFVYLYLFRLGFVMGRAGVKTCVLRMFYEYMIDLYLDELEDSRSPIALKYKDYIAERCGTAPPRGAVDFASPR